MFRSEVLTVFGSQAKTLRFKGVLLNLDIRIAPELPEHSFIVPRLLFHQRSSHLCFIKVSTLSQMFLFNIRSAGKNVNGNVRAQGYKTNVKNTDRTI